MELQNQQPEDISKESSLSPIQKRSYRKFVLWFLAIILTLFIVYPILRTLYNDYVAKRGFDAYFSAEQDYLNALKNDKYGGKTPEETYFMYLDALKKSDIALASKYYIGAEGPGRAYKWLARLQSEGWLEEYVSELPTDWSRLREQEYWMKDSKEFVFTYLRKRDIVTYPDPGGEPLKLLAGERQSSIIFQFSKPAQIWKLYQ